MPSWLSASLISSALMPVSRVGNASRSRSTPRFFFSSRRRHTRCGRYWSSDVCSSDLVTETLQIPEQWLSLLIGEIADVVAGGTPKANDHDNFAEPGTQIAWLTPADLSKYSKKYISHEIGRASCRERVKNEMATVTVKK